MIVRYRSRFDDWEIMPQLGPRDEITGAPIIPDDNFDPIIVEPRRGNKVTCPSCLSELWLGTKSAEDVRAHLQGCYPLAAVDYDAAARERGDRSRHVSH